MPCISCRRVTHARPAPFWGGFFVAPGKRAIWQSVTALSEVLTLGIAPDRSAVSSLPTLATRFSAILPARQPTSLLLLSFGGVHAAVPTRSGPRQGGPRLRRVGGRLR